MDIGSSVAVFLVLSLILLALFCFLTKYFHNKLKQTLQETAQIYSMVDELSLASQEGQDDKYAGAKQKVLGKKKKKQTEEDQMYVEMSDLKKPMHQNMDIYTPSILKQKLDQYYDRNNLETGRSISSVKKFAPEKINTKRSNNSNEQESLAAKSKIQPFTTKHTYINRLVCYDSQGISIIDVEMDSIKKLRDGVIKEKKKKKLENIACIDANFDDQLEIYGFEKGQFGCYKYETCLEVEDMKIMQDYGVKTLPSSETKQRIEIEDFVKFKFEMKLV